MTTYAVIRKSDGHEIYRYGADAPVEWVGMGFDLFDHVAQPAAPVIEPPVPDPAQWKIYVGAFFDRFGAYKLAILASADPLVQALIKDASVRKYIDLLGRRDELLQMIGLLQSKGLAVDAAAILDVTPTTDEVWNA